MPVYNAAPGPDMAAQIAQLATLRDKGVLTELEFTCAAPRPATRMPVRLSCVLVCTIPCLCVHLAGTPRPKSSRAPEMHCDTTQHGCG